MQAETSLPEPAGYQERFKKCKDNIDTTGATGSSRTPFAALIVCGQRSGSFALGSIQGFPTKESGWLQSFCVYHLESH